MQRCHRVRWAIFPGLAHKRLIRALQTYLHCKGLPLNTSQGLINALFKSCAPITNWLESSASSITQKRPLQIKIHMIYTWKALKGISYLLISHKCFKHPNFYLWFRKKLRACQTAACVCVCVCVWGGGWMRGCLNSTEVWKCALQTQEHTPLPLGINMNEAETWHEVTPQSNTTSLQEAGFYFTNERNDCNSLRLPTVIKQLSL